MVYQAKVLEPLGAVTTGSQFLDPDGKFKIGKKLVNYFRLVCQIK